MDETFVSFLFVWNIFNGTPAGTIHIDMTWMYLHIRTVYICCEMTSLE